MMKKWDPLEEKTKWQQIYGPPGTGKTYECVTRIRKLLKTIDPLSICYITHTNKAIDEVRERLSINKNDSDYSSFATMHSLCKQTLNEADKVYVSDENQEPFLEWARSNRIRGILKYGKTYGKNFIIKVYTLMRDGDMTFNKAYSVAADDDHKSYRYDPDTVSNLMDDWIKYKEDTGTNDFTDMILNAIKLNNFNHYRVVIIDEAQDCSQLQWDVVRALLSTGTVEYFFTAGDDDQSIYRWAGANVNTYLEFFETEVKRNYPEKYQECYIQLEESHRLSNTNIKFLKGISKYIKTKTVKTYKACKCCDHDESFTPKIHASLQKVPLKTGAWSIMASGSSTLEKNGKVLYEIGIWYSNQNRRRADPVLSSELLSPIRTYLKLQNDQEINFSELKKYRAMFLDFKEHELNELGQNRKFSAEYLKETFPQMNFDKPMYEFFNESYLTKKEKTGGDRMGSLAKWGEHRKYIKTCLDNNQDLSLDPKVVLSTIHKMKGGQADNVLVIAEMEQPRYSAYKSEDPEREDDVHRLYYTACSRARHQLHILSIGNTRSYGFESIYILNYETE
mgnify:CR=1 FL=1